MFFGFILRKLRFIADYARTQKESGDKTPDADNQDHKKIKVNLQDNLKNLKTALGNGSDIKTHYIRFGPDNELSAALVFIDGLVDNIFMTESILRPMKNWQVDKSRLPEKAGLLDMLKQDVLCASDITDAESLLELMSGCLSGDTVMLADGCAGGLIISTKGWEKRSVTEPQSETVVRGPREGFTENIRTNTSLIRRKIRSGRLRSEQMTVGRKTQTNICLMYISGVADPNVVETVKQRIGLLDVESILETGYIEEYIEDAPFSIFPTVAYSEKPDVIAAQVLEGRVAILVDGTPFVLTVPMLFIESFQTAEDYYVRPIYASLIRMIRFMAFLLTVFAPAIYIALNSFHHELIPTTLLFTIAKAREGTPFPVFFEALIMIFAFEILREAGVRLPRPVGQAISIVGALIMGDAAVNAGIVGAPMVITVAVTAVASFLVPTQNESSSILRVIMMIPAAFIGLYGVGLGFIAMLIHLATLESFGVPYFDNFGHSSDTQDTLIRMPLWYVTRRPNYIARGDITKGKRFVPPLRPHSSEDDGGEP